MTIRRWWAFVLVLCGAGVHRTSAQRTVATGAPHSTSDIREAQAALGQVIDVQIDGKSLSQAIDAIAERGNVTVLYRETLLRRYTNPVTIHMMRVSLGAALDRVLIGTGLAVVPLAHGRIAIAEGGGVDVAATSAGIVVGRVIDAQTQRPLAGATVRVDEASHGAVTADDGSFRVTGLAAGSHQVVIRLLGYEKQVHTIRVTEGETVTLSVMLQSSANTLDQVVVTGTVIPTELKAVPNAITVITAKEIEQRGITQIDQLFRGDVPGVFAQRVGATSSALLDEVTMFSRGATALSNASAGVSKNNGGLAYTNPMKTYVDGVELADPKYLSQIDPKNIERIEILTGPQASTIYGSNAINGVMQVFTKRGTSNTPQLTLNLLSGWVENNFSNAHTPQHDYSAQVTGVEGRLAYNAGGAWNYIGAWTPAKQSARLGTFGGARLSLPTALGAVTADVTFRQSVTQSRQRGTLAQTQVGYYQTGWYNVLSTNGLSRPAIETLQGQTLGLTVGYTPTAWWSHELGIGQDVSNTESRVTARGYTFRSDTTLSLQQGHASRQSLRYVTTVRAPVTSMAQATMTLGADAWQTLSSFLDVSPQTLTGSLTGSTSMSRQPGHNTGGFLQAQLGASERLFLTYGLRAEWNPNYGADAQPNFSPRYGVAYTQALGGVTAKLRASYGRSTRPPGPGKRGGKTSIQVFGAGAPQIADYGNYKYFLANPELAPEHQQGGEGGLELYFGSRSSLVVTRYNQTVDDLIDSPLVDSVRSLVPYPVTGGDYPSVPDANGYAYRYQYQYVNMGSIRNQGWELQGTTALGHFATRGTYSWTKSRTIGVNPKYRSFFAIYQQYQPGATLQSLPEHTWALGITYAQSHTTMQLNLNGVGRVPVYGSNDLYYRSLSSNVRLPQNRLSFTSRYVAINPAYVQADLMGSHQLNARLEAVLYVQNVSDRYVNDVDAIYPTMGRQTKAGFRIRL